jgi:DnaJ domain
MLQSEYYDILGLTARCTVEDIKKAYRNKARLYHPDINHAPEAKDQFIKATEAYDFLLINHGKILTDEQEFIRIVEEWRKYRQDRSRQRAQYYARKSYLSFKNSKYYRTTRMLNGSSIIFNFAIAIMVLIYTVLGFILKLRNPVPDDPPPLFSFIVLLTLSLILFTVSFIYLKAFIEERKKRGKGR